MIYVLATARWFFRHRQLRDWSRWTLASFAMVWVTGLSKRPSSDRLWASDHRIQPVVEREDDVVTIRSLRHCRYSSEVEFTSSHDDFTFRLSQLTHVWFAVHRFTSLQGIAHNFLSFKVDTDDGPRYFSVSVEVRREEGEVFSPLKGMYREFELIYVFADELDEIGQRLQFRPDDRVYLFPVNATAEQVQTLFGDIAERANRLHVEPEFYHSLLNNCTNNIVLHTRPLTDSLSWTDPRIVAPGFADRYAKCQGLIGNSEESFSVVRDRCRLRKVDAVATSEEFSEAIRRQLTRR